MVSLMPTYSFCTGNLQEPSLKITDEKMILADNYKQVFGNICFGPNFYDIFVICAHTSVIGALLIYLMLY